MVTWNLIKTFNEPFRHFHYFINLKKKILFSHISNSTILKISEGDMYYKASRVSIRVRILKLEIGKPYDQFYKKMLNLHVEK